MTGGSSTGTSERELRDADKGGEKKKTAQSRSEKNRAKRSNKQEKKRRKAQTKTRVEYHNASGSGSGSGSDSDSGSESDSPPAKRKKQGTTSSKKQEKYMKQLQNAELHAPPVPAAMLAENEQLQSDAKPVTTCILVKGADLAVDWFTAEKTLGHCLIGVGAGGSGIDSKQGVDGSKKSAFTKKQCAMAIKAWNAIAKVKSGMPLLRPYSTTHELPEGAQQFLSAHMWSTIGSRNNGGKQDMVSKVLERIATTPLREVSTDICLTVLYSVDHLFDNFVFR